MGTFEKALFLYSSNTSPLYEQDILDLLAAPRGYRFQFRYFRRWIDEEVRAQWEALGGAEALIHFSIQQNAEYHPPAFIPVRLATVVDAQIVGSTHTLEFELGDHVALSRAHEKGKDREVYGEAVQNYANELEAKGVPRPYRKWIGFGCPVDQLDALRESRAESTNSMLLFERATEFLARTKSFSGARFFWIAGLHESGEDGDTLQMRRGRFYLKAGRSYELLVAHYQPVGPIETEERFGITSDESIIRIIGAPEFTVASRYDVVRVYLHAAQASVNEERETVVAFDPAPGTQGPRLRLRVVVTPDIGRNVTAVAGSAAAALLLGLPGLNPGIDFGWKMTFVIGASLLFGFLASFGLKRV